VVPHYCHRPDLGTESRCFQLMSKTTALYAVPKSVVAALRHHDVVSATFDASLRKAVVATLVARQTRFNVSARQNMHDEGGG